MFSRLHSQCPCLFTRKFLILLALLVFLSGVAVAQSADPSELLDEPGITKVQRENLALAIQNFWTAEEMAKAQAMPIPEWPFDEFTLKSGEVDAEPVLLEKAGYAPGWRPGEGRQPGPDEMFTFGPEELPGKTLGALQPKHGSAPSNPRSGPYGPFQRWTEFDSILVYPKSTHGRLFFRLNGQSFVCSATVIHRNTLITAGHCNSDGNGNFATNRMFCPSYRNGVSSRGCWSVINSKTSSRWHNLGDPDYDYACLVTSATGSSINNRIGNVTGWIGRSWNFPSGQAVRTFGYPAASPFNGTRLMTTASVEWYNFHFRSGGQASRIIGSDLTGGSSGGSWVLGWQRPGHERSDTDGSMLTDPGNNWVSGVNSHKRCRSNCSNPPTNTQGVFWQEMSSPPFRNTSAGDESEDIIRVCLNNGGS